MKKRICTLLLTAALLLTGCGAKQKPIIHPNSQLDYTQLRVLPNGDENGMYLFNREGSTKRRQVCYIDYATQCAVPLCAQPNCSHDSDACTACMPLGDSFENVTAGGVYVLNADTIVEVYTRETAYDENGENHWEWRIDLLNRNGSNRRNLFCAKDGALNFTWREGIHKMWADQDALYFKTEPMTEGQETAGLYRLPLTGGEPELCVSDEKMHGTLEDVWNGKLVLYQYVPVLEGPAPEELFPLTENMSDQEMEDVFQKRQDLWDEIWNDPDRPIHLSLLDPATGEIQTLQEWKNAETSSRIFRVEPEKNKLWWLTQKGEAGWLDTTGMTGTLDLQWPEEVVNAYQDAQPEDPFTLKQVRILDGQMLFTMTDPCSDGQWGRESSGETRYALDLATGQVRALPQKFISYVPIPVQIWGQSPNDFVVQFAENAAQISNTDADGNIWDEAGVRPCVGLISHEELLAGKSNYREIQIDCALATQSEIG